MNETKERTGMNGLELLMEASSVAVENLLALALPLGRLLSMCKGWVSAWDIATGHTQLVVGRPPGLLDK